MTANIKERIIFGYNTLIFSSLYEEKNYPRFE